VGADTNIKLKDEVWVTEREIANGGRGAESEGTVSAVVGEYYKWISKIDRKSKDKNYRTTDWN
jgi:hypothetical protein